MHVATFQVTRKSAFIGYHCGSVTCQMNLDSYEMTGLRVSLNLVNQVTPGQAGGASYAGGCTFEGLRKLLQDDPPSVEQLEERHTNGFQELAHSLREVFVFLSIDETSDAANRLNQLLAENPATPELGREPDGRWRMHQDRDMRGGNCPGNRQSE
ncbi:ABATE domain-containing protein [Leisingera sp. JC1]|uniref:ABATE domain-containing protein n=1 Tax=Leisingera sp. JC1 TaxID=1855282 RepID=UPI0011308DD1